MSGTWLTCSRGVVVAVEDLASGIPEPESGLDPAIGRMSNEPPDLHSQCSNERKGSKGGTYQSGINL